MNDRINTQTINDMIADLDKQYSKIIRDCDEAIRDLDSQLQTNEKNETEGNQVHQSLNDSAKFTIKDEIKKNEDWFKEEERKIEEHRKNIQEGAEEEKERHIKVKYNSRINKENKDFEGKKADIEQEYAQLESKRKKEFEKNIAGMNTTKASRALQLDQIKRKKSDANEELEKAKGEVEQEVDNYAEELKNQLRVFGIIDNVDKSRLESSIRTYYEKIKEVEELKKEYEELEGFDSESNDSKWEKEINTNNKTAEKRNNDWKNGAISELERKHRERIDKIDEELENEIKEIEENSQKRIKIECDEVLQSRKKELEDKNAQVVSDISKKKEKMDRKIKERLEAISQEKEQITAKKKQQKRENKEKIEKFQTGAKKKIDDKLALKCDCEVGVNSNRFRNLSFPENICIGYRHEAIKDCAILRDIYGGAKNLKYNSGNPVMLDMRHRGNIMINASTKYETNEKLYSIVCGLTMKYLEVFPVSSMYVHFYDSSNSNNYFTIFCNNLGDFISKSINIDTELDKVIASTEEIGRHISSDTRDIYDFYPKDNSNLAKMHLIVIRNGFKDFVREGYNGTSTLRKIRNLMQEGGVLCGARFIIVNDFDERNELSNNPEESKKMLKTIKEQSMIFDFDGNNIYSNSTPVELSRISEKAPVAFIEKQLKEYSGIKKEADKKKLTYEDIGFGIRDAESGYQSTIRIPIGRYGDKVYELPFDSGNEVKIQHWLAIGVSGSGKSSLFDSMILNGAMKYSPDDLKFWLLDFKGKEGSGSEKYSGFNIPHIERMTLNNNPNNAVEIFELLRREVNRRISLMSGASIGRKEIQEYNKYVDENPDKGEHLHRIVLVVDEAQSMFDDIRDDSVEELKKNIAYLTKTGRSSGVHMVMIAQNLTGGGGQLKSCFVDQAAVGRIVFKIDDQDVLNSSMPNSFCRDHANDVRGLSAGECFVVSPELEVSKSQVAYHCDHPEKYSKAIAEKYGKGSALIVGITDLLKATDKVIGSGDQYGKAIETPKVVYNHDTEKMEYILTVGEDNYLIKPATATLVNNDSTLWLIGKDDRISQSLCISILRSLCKVENSTIFVCDVWHNRGKFSDAAKKLEKNIDLCYPADLDGMIDRVYSIYSDRKAKGDKGESVSSDPVFLMISKLDPKYLKAGYSSNEPDSATKMSELIRNGGEYDIYCVLRNENVPGYWGEYDLSLSIWFNDINNIQSGQDTSELRMRLQTIRNKNEDYKNNDHNGSNSQETRAILCKNKNYYTIRPVLY